MVFKPIQKLSVVRTLSTGAQVKVGVLAQNSQGVFFQYDESYLQSFGNLSHFTLQPNTQLQAAPKQPHLGIHGVFGDSLPDSWGMLLQDRLFRQKGILPAQITAMDRLALVGNKGMGALSFLPFSAYISETQTDTDIAALGLEAQALFDDSMSNYQDNYDQSHELFGKTQKVLAALVAVGSSGGARPKAQIYMPASDAKQCRTYPEPSDEAWLIKFTSKHLPLGHEEGLCEAVYLQMAKFARCQPPDWQLIVAPHNSGASAWLALKRFDYIAAQNSSSQANNTNKIGRLHLHSACGLLDADYRLPSLDYNDLIKMSRQLCQSPAAGQLQFRRALFNLLAVNQDDHSKNWAFLQNDDSQWQPAPFYDVTYSPHPFNEHTTAFGGYGKTPPLKTIQELAASAGFANWSEAKQVAQEISEVLSQFTHLAKQLDIRQTTIAAINKAVTQSRKENSVLFK